VVSLIVILRALQQTLCYREKMRNVDQFVTLLRTIVQTRRQKTTDNKIRDAYRRRDEFVIRVDAHFEEIVHNN